ncbi:MAG: hypothetical protein LBQ54_04055 [Planctomycetaceae bacterium]|nr:hypothetical protein [Planctomycetaceae bacterium]
MRPKATAIQRATLAPGLPGCNVCTLPVPKATNSLPLVAGINWRNYASNNVSKLKANRTK